jgi:hypothetical protein
MPWAGLTWLNGLTAGIIAVILGIIVIVFPKILNYAIGAILVIFGTLWLISDQQWLLGISSIAFGILVFIFPAILNYLVAAWLVVVGLGLIFGPGYTTVGIITLIFGVVVLVFPAILNYLYGIFLIVIGLIAIANHYGWFGEFFMLLPLIWLPKEKDLSCFIKPISRN